MSYNLSFDYSSIILLTILVIYYFVIPKYKNFQNRLFGAILVINLLGCTLDVVSVMLMNSALADAFFLNRLVLAVYQFCQHSLATLYYVYMMFIIHGSNAESVITKRWPILLPAIFVEIVNLSSAFTQWAFVYDENGYQRTFFYFVCLANLAFYMLLCLYLVFKYRVKTGFVPKLVVFFYSVASVAAAVFQYFFPDTLIISFSATLTIFAMYLALQNPVLLKEALEDAEKSKREAEKANEAKAAFLANMSHEIRTPMNAICGMAYLLDTANLNKEARDYVDTIQNASESLLSLINEILDFSKVDAGKMTLNEHEYDLESIIKEVDSILLSSGGEKKGIVPSLYVEPNIPRIMWGDSQKIKQILINLLSNAVKFTESGEVSLEISVQRLKDNMADLIIKVRDTGIGIREEDKDRIFAQFEQVDMAKNRRHEGTGLGLALVKGYCEIMNGSISFESEFGRGSTFTAVVEQKILEDYPAHYFDKLKQFNYIILENNPYTKRSIEHTLKSIGAEYTFTNAFDKVLMQRFKEKNNCVIYNDEHFSEEVNSLDTENFPEFERIAGVSPSSPAASTNVRVHYLRGPLSILSLFRCLGGVDIATRKKEETTTIKFKPETRVALVDDNKVNLKVTSAILKRFGIEAKTMLSGFEIIKEFEEGAEYDLVFMDHMMPEMDGIETVKKIRALGIGNTATVPIIALTANAISGVEQEYHDAGMNATLFKPANAEELRKTLEKWLPKELLAVD